MPTVRARLFSLWLVAVAGCSRPGSSVDPAGGAHFAHDVMPVLVEHCARCHAAGVTFGAFDTAQTAWPYLTGPLQALPTGFHCGGQPVQRERLIVPGDPATSPLWQLVGMGFDVETGECPGRPGHRMGMPKDAAGILADVDPDAATLIERWILAGARDD